MKTTTNDPFEDLFGDEESPAEVTKTILISGDALQLVEQLKKRFKIQTYKAIVERLIVCGHKAISQQGNSQDDESSS